MFLSSREWHCHDIWRIFTNISVWFCIICVLSQRNSFFEWHFLSGLVEPLFIWNAAVMRHKLYLVEFPRAHLLPWSLSVTRRIRSRLVNYCNLARLFPWINMKDSSVNPPWVQELLIILTLDVSFISISWTGIFTAIIMSQKIPEASHSFWD